MLPFVDFLGHSHSFLGQAWAEGKGEFATSRHRGDCGQENRAKHRSNASMIKQIEHIVEILTERCADCWETAVRKLKQG